MVVRLLLLALLVLVVGTLVTRRPPVAPVPELDGCLAPAHATALAGSSLGVLLVLSVTGLVQLGVAVRRNLDRGTTSAAE